MRPAAIKTRVYQDSIKARVGLYCVTTSVDSKIHSNIEMVYHRKNAPKWYTGSFSQWKQLSNSGKYTAKKNLETPAEHDERLVKLRDTQHAKEAAETSEERDARRAKNNDIRHEREELETPAERDARLAKHNDHQRAKMAAETSEEHDARRAEKNKNEKDTRHAREAAETSEERAERLDRNNKYAKDRRQVENDKYSVHEWDTEYRGGATASPRAGQCRNMFQQ
jgi:hypothetical protein